MGEVEKYQLVIVRFILVLGVKPIFLSGEGPYSTLKLPMVRGVKLVWTYL